MDNMSQHPWRTQMAAPLPAESIGKALSDDHPQWEYIDGEMVKLGSLAHSSLDIAEIQRVALTLLASESKDFRLVVHLLRTLQHGGKPAEILLALFLLADYIELYWSSAWPTNAIHKRRLAQQVLKRFTSTAAVFSQQADQILKEEVLGQLARLAQLWQRVDESALAKDVDSLGDVFRRRSADTAPSVDFDRAPSIPVSSASILPSSTSILPSSTLTTPAPLYSTPIESVNIDSGSDRAWRHTLLKVTEILCERQPDVAMGYRLRRHVMWSAIDAPPPAQEDGRTPLAAVPADRVASYSADLPSATLTLWQQVEHSLTLAPYWFHGHYLSAQIATHRGHHAVAQAIREELMAFINRLPELERLSFSDKTPFITAEVARWLAQSVANSSSGTTAIREDILQCYQQQGLEPALQAINQQSPPEPRDRFYNQLLSAQLLESAGLQALAQQHYHHLWLAGKQLLLTEWEPSLFTMLVEKAGQGKC